MTTTPARLRLSRSAISAFLLIKPEPLAQRLLPQSTNGDAIKIYNERGEFGARAQITDDVLPGVVWIRDGWVGLKHLTSGDAVLTGDALNLFPFSVGQADYGAKVEVART